MRSNVRARINMPTVKIIGKLIKAGFASHDKWGGVVANPMTGMVNMDHYTILQFYNSKIQGIVNYFSFAGNRSEIGNII
jgi:hypothetical protein